MKRYGMQDQFKLVSYMPELLQRLDDASKSLPKMIKKGKIKIAKFNTDDMPRHESRITNYSVFLNIL